MHKKRSQWLIKSKVSSAIEGSLSRLTEWCVVYTDPVAGAAGPRFSSESFSTSRIWSPPSAAPRGWTASASPPVFYRSPEMDPSCQHIVIVARSCFVTNWSFLSGFTYGKSWLAGCCLLSVSCHSVLDAKVLFIHPVELCSNVLDQALLDYRHRILNRRRLL